MSVLLTVSLKIYTDSSAAKSITTRHGPGKSSKHIALRYLFVQDLVRTGVVMMRKVSTTEMSSDCLTKYVSRDVLHHHLIAIGIVTRAVNNFGFSKGYENIRLPHKVI